MRKLLLVVCTAIGLVTAVTAYGEAGLADQVLAEINLARTNPKAYAGFLREFRTQFRGKDYRQPGSPILIRTTEGAGAVDEAIRVLSRQKPLQPLSWSRGLAAAAAELVEDEGESGMTGHVGHTSGSPLERIERHGTWQGLIGESIGYGPDKARAMVMQLIIDDGVPDRGHRKSIFTPAYRTAGVACGPHPRYGNMCAIDFAAGFRERR
ncbi:CAP domain-containing protein [Geomobilimonas luticola]|uniref:CAP domain-containing protein n=1 Tax=Geomobilimonas luticola TaxID=1114878 RepID=A0ABS5SDH8_9BACT|nr:CAP domain-containing protein [Geomobilimonas luticola]MBT0653424.1 CAP domain-containing protein [Geomobilimonas luticola]